MRSFPISNFSAPSLLAKSLAIKNLLVKIFAQNLSTKEERL